MLHFGSVPLRISSGVEGSFSKNLLLTNLVSDNILSESTVALRRFHKQQPVHFQGERVKI